MVPGGLLARTIVHLIVLFWVWAIAQPMLFLEALEQLVQFVLRLLHVEHSLQPSRRGGAAPGVCGIFGRLEDLGLRHGAWRRCEIWRRTQSLLLIGSAAQALAVGERESGEHGEHGGGKHGQHARGI